MITLQFITEPSFGSWIIRYVTNDEFSHVDCVLPSGLHLPDGSISKGWELLGARMSGEVAIRQPGYANFSRIAQYTCDVMTQTQEQMFYMYLLSKVGLPYDWKGILNLAAHRRRDWYPEQPYYFCSALQDAASVVAQNAFLMGDPNKFSPRDLTLSPKLKLKFDQTPPYSFAAKASGGSL